MIWPLRIVFLLIIAVMLVVTGKAMMIESILDIPRVVQGDPWFQATLWDAYFGFLTFYLWVLYKKPGLFCRILWFVVIMSLGNIGMAIFMLLLLFRLPPNANMWQVLLNERDAARMTPGGGRDV